MSSRINVIVGRMVGAVLVVGMALGAHAQVKPNADAELKKLADEFAQAWGKGDAKALAALHTQDAIRIPGDGQVVSGCAAIEQNLSQGLSGIWKGSTITITPGQTRQLTADAAVGEGRYQIALGVGRFLITGCGGARASHTSSEDQEIHSENQKQLLNS